MNRQSRVLTVEVNAEDISSINETLKRIEDKLNRLMAVFGLSDNQTKRLSTQEMDDVIKKSVMRFRKRHSKLQEE